MFRLLGPQVWTEITSAAERSRTPANAAVAYFGSDGHRMLPLTEGSSLVVDATIPTVKAGATSPASLRRLRRRGVQVYSAQHLHAKLFAFDEVAFVGSANASLHSKKTLLEAVMRVECSEAVAEVREFVQSLCVTELDDHELVELGKFYRPPKQPKRTLHREQPKYSTLVMQLTLEQGRRRVTQVQPPNGVWNHFFGVRVGIDAPPTLCLISERAEPTPFQREVVEHDHNYTIEIPEAALPRPAILRVRRLDVRTYSYAVLRPGDAAYDAMHELLATRANPLRTHGRHWVIV